MFYQEQLLLTLGYTDGLLVITYHNCVNGIIITIDGVLMLFYNYYVPATI